MLQDIRNRVFSQVNHGAQYWLCLSTLCVSFVFGGGSRQLLPSEFVCQVFGVVFLAAALARLVNDDATGRFLPELALAGLFLALPILQVVPLPPFIWSHLPGRGALVEEFMVTRGSLPWQPLSVSPDATYQAMFSLCGPLAVFVSGLLLTLEERRILSLFILAFGMLSVILAMLQVVQGPESPLRFYTITNTMLPVGFFANRNHFAAFTYCMLPLSAAWIVGLGLKVRRSRRTREIDHRRLFLYIVAIGAFAVFLLVQGLIHSRAGLVLTILSAILSFCLVIPFRNSELGAKAIRSLLAALVVAVILMAYYASYRIFQQFDRDAVDDARFTILTGALKALRAFFPFGSGIGTFDVVYRAFELPGAASSEYINRAHDDIVETLIEGGLLSLGVIALFAVWLARAWWRVWSAKFRQLPALDASLARAGAMVPLLLISHSFLDYPLRTGAVMSLLAFCCALTVYPINRSPDEDAPEKVRRTHRMRSKPAAAAIETAP